MSDLKRKAISGFFWQAFGLVGQQGIAFIANLIFARVLLKAENGIVFAAVAIVDYADLLRVAGLSQAFVAYEGDDKETRHTIFWASLISGVAVSAVLYLGAPFAANIEKVDGLAPILRVLALTQLVDSFRIVPFTLVWRQLRFKHYALAETIPFFIGLLVAIIALFILPTEQRIWSLAIMYLARSVARAIMFNVFQPYIPKRVFDSKFFRIITKRSTAILGTNLPAVILEPLPTLFVVPKAGVAAGGTFGLAMKVTAPASRLAHSANITLFPIFARLRDDHEKLAPAVLRSFRSVGVLSTALFAFLLVASAQLIPLLLGDKWLDAIPVTQVLAIAFMFKLYSYLASTALLAVNKARYSTVMWGSTLILAVALLWAWPMRQGDAMPGAVITLIYTAFTFLIALIAMSLELQIMVLDMMRALAPATVSSVAAGLASYAAALPFASHPLLALLVKIVVFFGVFAPIAGTMLGGGWKSLLSPKGIRELVGKN